MDEDVRRHALAQQRRQLLHLLLSVGPLALHTLQILGEIHPY